MKTTVNSSVRRERDDTRFGPLGYLRDREVYEEGVLSCLHSASSLAYRKGNHG